MHANDREYQDHDVFDELKHYIEFYEALASAVFLWKTPGTRAIANIDSYVLSSIQGTLASIRTILRNGRINDAYALLRKYYDSAIINIYSNLYLEEHVSLEKLIVEQIDNWLKGKARLPEYRIVSQYIRSSSRVATVTDLLFADDRYKRLRDRCNEHTHYNFFRSVLLNDDRVYVPERRQALDDLSKDVRDVFILHVAYLFTAKENYMMSSDYIDALECGMTPEQDSEYWVAPFVQEVFDDIVTKHRPDVAAAMKHATRMQLA